MNLSNEISESWSVSVQGNRHLCTDQGTQWPAANAKKTLEPAQLSDKSAFIWQSPHNSVSELSETLYRPEKQLFCGLHKKRTTIWCFYGI